MGSYNIKQSRLPRNSQNRRTSWNVWYFRILMNSKRCAPSMCSYIWVLILTLTRMYSLYVCVYFGRHTLTLAFVSKSEIKHILTLEDEGGADLTRSFSKCLILAHRTVSDGHLSLTNSKIIVGDSMLEMIAPLLQSWRILSSLRFSSGKSHWEVIK